MRFLYVPMHGRRCLGAAVAIDGVETQGNDGMLTGIALEGDASVHSLGGVLAHNYIVVALFGPASGKRCTPFEWTTPPRARF
jgi:hypothetical protein